ncbi:MAG: putative diguanylate cyclase [Sphingomonas bacterium]|uniref:GGDEF domain-containing protein n=1 Tax=Sphingomonas bacterium TaxID=1895847 RepID=UPI0026205753|nr:GGDEF domain-containing protein [Sphingomonas bacterium]MDB5704437.1 putative diguanylate cyclase [Sphingomonas bacterium]
MLQHLETSPVASPVPSRAAGRVSRWMARPDAGQGTAAPDADAAFDVEGARRTQAELLFEEIGTFLFANGLGLSATNFMCAHDYLTHADHRLERSIQAMFASRTSLSNGWVEDFYAASTTSALRPEAIASTTEQVAVVLTQCLELVERSRGNADVYSDALQAEADRLTSVEALPAVERLIGLTQAMLDQTRDIQEELRHRSIETTQLRTTLQSAQREAHVDHLTKLPNRRDFDTRLKQVAEASAREGRPATIALCDIDHFKAINDAHGHDTGDRVLMLVASALQAGGLHIGAEGKFYVARFGGEEFAMIFEDCEAAAAGAIVDTLRRDLAARRLVNQVTRAAIGHVTFSAGIAPLDPEGGGAASLKLADTALYSAKQGGRNRVCGAAGGDICPASDLKDARLP